MSNLQAWIIQLGSALEPYLMWTLALRSIQFFVGAVTMALSRLPRLQDIILQARSDCQLAPSPVAWCALRYL